MERFRDFEFEKFQSKSGPRLARVKLFTCVLYTASHSMLFKLILHVKCVNSQFFCRQLGWDSVSVDFRFVTRN
jgi:hypothetical protein